MTVSEAKIKENYEDVTFSDIPKHDTQNGDQFKPDYKAQVEQQNSKVENLSRGQKKQLTIQDILKKLSRNERGDAELFLEIFKDKYVFDHSEGKFGEFYFWNGSHWQADIKKERYRDMEAVSRYYEWAASQLQKDRSPDNAENKETDKDSKLLRARAYSLRTAKRCKSVFEFVAIDISFKGEWDHCPSLLPCKNGIVDLKTGVLLTPHPEDYIRTVCPTEYKPDAQYPLFNQFLIDITLNRIDIQNCIEDAFGSSLEGIPKEERVFYFYGEDGRNGKGTLLQTLEKVLGNLAKTFPSEMLLLQRNPPSSSSPSPETANFQGVRFAIFSEINKGRKIDSSKVKNYSGRDTIPCRRLYSNVDLQITPSHTMFIQTNYKPEAPSDDNALWSRNVLIPFDAHFCDDPKSGTNQRKKDPEFKAKLLQEKEGILAWLVKCCINYHKHGLRIPDIVKKATEDYRKENDGIQLFIDECCTIDSTLQTPCSQMQKTIKEFCQDLHIQVPNEREISKRLESQFQKKKSNKGWRYHGIGITPRTWDE